MRIKKLLKSTSNSSVYKKARKIYLARKGEVECEFCDYHRFENGWYYKYYDRSWKHSRKTQYKSN
jgi:hypothetical protein